MAYAARSQEQDHTNVKLVYKAVQFFPLNYNRNMSLKQNQILHTFANGVEYSNSLMNTAMMCSFASCRENP